MRKVDDRSKDMASIRCIENKKGWKRDGVLMMYNDDPEASHRQLHTGPDARKTDDLYRFNCDTPIVCIRQGIMVGRVAVLLQSEYSVSVRLRRSTGILTGICRNAREFRI